MSKLFCATLILMLTSCSEANENGTFRSLELGGNCKSVKQLEKGKLHHIEDLGHVKMYSFKVAFLDEPWIATYGCDANNRLKIGMYQNDLEFSELSAARNYAKSIADKLIVFEGSDSLAPKTVKNNPESIFWNRGNNEVSVQLGKIYSEGEITYSVSILYRVEPLSNEI